MTKNIWKATLVTAVCALAICLAGCATTQPSQSESSASKAIETQTESASATESTSASEDAAVTEEQASEASEAQEQEGTQDPAKDEEELNHEATDIPEGYSVVQCENFRLVLPSDLMAQLAWEQPNENCITASLWGITLFEIACYDLAGNPGTEWKHRDYLCGYGANASGWHEVTARFYYITADGQWNAHWGDSQATDLALTYTMGINELDFLAYLQVQVASGERLGTPAWDSVYPVMTSDDWESASEPEPDEEVDYEYDGTVQPFWGVWIGAFKHLESAEEYAAEARNDGYSYAAVYVSSDWSNLNAETWYVVSIDQAVSQGDAEQAALIAQQKGYDGAYAKYTGDYIG